MANYRKSKLGYFFSEVAISFKKHKTSHFVSIISICLIFVLLGLIIGGWWTTRELISIVEKEGEVSVFFNENMNDHEIETLRHQIEIKESVTEVHYIDEEAAWDRMSDLLGEEAGILEYFEENPLSPFLEVSIPGDQIDQTRQAISNMEGVEYTRSNRDILMQLQSLLQTIVFAGSLVGVLSMLTTIIITSHIVRLGMLAREQEIITLRLLGASKWFVASPFLLEAIILGSVGGVLASGMLLYAVPVFGNYLSQAMPFIPLPAWDIFLYVLLPLIPVTGAVFALLGSLLTVFRSEDKFFEN